MGNKILRQRLRGAAMASYYPKRAVTFRDLKETFAPDLHFMNWEDIDRLEHLDGCVLSISFACFAHAWSVANSITVSVPVAKALQRERPRPARRRSREGALYDITLCRIRHAFACSYYAVTFSVCIVLAFWVGLYSHKNRGFTNFSCPTCMCMLRQKQRRSISRCHATSACHEYSTVLLRPLGEERASQVLISRKLTCLVDIEPLRRSLLPRILYGIGVFVVLLLSSPSTSGTFCIISPSTQCFFPLH